MPCRNALLNRVRDVLSMARRERVMSSVGLWRLGVSVTRTTVNGLGRHGGGVTHHPYSRKAPQHGQKWIRWQEVEYPLGMSTSPKSR